MEKVVIEIKNLTKFFNSKKVLDNLNLQIFKGETVVILGQSGCGKSVLLKHIVGLLKPNQGQIFINGEKITSLQEGKMNEIRKKIGMLFQSAALFDSLTVGENVGFMLEEHSNFSSQEINKIISDKLKMVELTHCENLKPIELSGGMRKRVGLARAIAFNPEIILYDEPTGGLDLLTAEVINNLIIKMQKELDVTSLVVTHDVVSATKIANRIAILYQGKIVEIDTPEQIRKSTNSIIQQFLQAKIT